MTHEASGTPPAKPELQEVSAPSSGQTPSDAYVAELLKPTDEILRDRGRGDLAFYDKILRDDQVKSAWQQRRLAVVSKEWEVTPGGDAPIDVLAADFMREQLQHINFDRTTLKMLNGIMLGYAVSECMWAADGTRVVLDAIKVRRAARFKFDAQRQLRLITSGNPKGLVMPERKFWVFTSGAEDDDDPYGRGLAYWLYWPAWFKRNGVRFWSIYMDKFAGPTTKGKFPPSADQAERDKLLEAMQAITTESAIALPEGFDVELLEAAKSAGGDYGRFYDKMDAAIAKVILSQTMTTDDGSSQSQATVHENVKKEVIKADGDLCCDSWNEGPAVWLTEWNFPGAAPPKVRRIVEDEEDLSERADRDKKLYEIGYEPTDEYVLETYGPGFQKIAATEPPNSNSAAFAEGGAPREPDMVDDLVAGILDDDGWEALVGPIVDDIEAFIEGGGTLEQVRDNLAKAIAKTDVSAFGEKLSQAGFAAEIAGQLGIDLNDNKD